MLRKAAGMVPMGKDGKDSVRVTTTLTTAQHDAVARIAAQNHVKVAWIIRLHLRLAGRVELRVKIRIDSQQLINITMIKIFITTGRIFPSNYCSLDRGRFRRAVSPPCDRRGVALAAAASRETPGAACLLA